LMELSLARLSHRGMALVPGHSGAGNWIGAGRSASQGGSVCLFADVGRFGHGGLVAGRPGPQPELETTHGRNRADGGCGILLGLANPAWLLARQRYLVRALAGS